MPKEKRTKPIRPPVNHESAYRIALIAMIEQVKSALYKKLKDTNASNNTQYQAVIDSVFNEYIGNVLLGVTLANRFVKLLDRYHKGMFLASIRQATGLDVEPLLNAQVIDLFMDQAITDNVNFNKEYSH